MIIMLNFIGNSYFIASEFQVREHISEGPGASSRQNDDDRNTTGRHLAGNRNDASKETELV